MNTIKTLLLLLAILGFAGCSKEDGKKEDNNPAKYDKSNLGSYSGVLVGSTGYITIELKPTGASATIVFDGVTYQLSSSVPIPAGTKVTGYTLQKDGVKIVLDVNADGSEPQVAVTIPGHNVSTVVFKVTSTADVENYVGTVTGTDAQSPQYNNSGIFNFSVKGNEVVMMIKCVSGNCDGDYSTQIEKARITRSGDSFSIHIDDCDPNDTICTLPFTKTATGYRYVEVLGPGLQVVWEVKKVG